MRGKRGILLVIAILCFVGAIVTSKTSTNAPTIKNEPSPTPTQAPLKRSITVTAVGDCTLATDITTPVYGSFESKVDEVGNDYSYFLRNVAPIFSEDDLTIVNFEGTLSDRGERADKTFAFRGSPEYVNILTSSSVEAAGLANNHSVDYGQVSFDDTVEHLTNAGVLNFAGESVSVSDVNGIKVGLVGINALNDTGISQIEPSIMKAKTNGAELVILCIHWGVEKAESPTDTQKMLARRAIDAGADIVLGSHPHVLQGVEKYNGKYIVYSLGNFCFGGNTNPSDKDSVIVRVVFTVDENGNVADDDNIEFIPCRISSRSDCNDYQPTVAEGDEKTRIIEKINYRTSLIAPLTLKFR